MNWKQWGIGALNAALSAAASALPATFVGVNAKSVAIIAGTSALVSFVKWVIQHPLPGTPTS